MPEATSHEQPYIVIVDDEPFFRRLLREMLEERGYPVLEASSGRGVPDLVARHNVGAVLADIEMPDLSGPDVLRRVKRLRPDVPVIMVSAHQDFARAHEVLRAGALDYLVKPLQPRELFAAVERALLLLETTRDASRAIRLAEQRLSELVLLREVGATASSEPHLQQLLDRILELVRDFLKVEIVSLLMPDEDGLLHIRSAQGLDPKIVERARVMPGQGVAGYVYASGEPVLLEDIAGDDRFQVGGREEQYRTGSLLSVPIRYRDRSVGVLNVNNKKSGEPFDAFDLNLLSVIAHQTALALENFKLVSNLRRHARELEQANRELQRHQQARARLVYSLSQQLKLPLDAARSYLEMLAHDTEALASEEGNAYLLYALERCEQLDRLLVGMLCLFSLDSGGGEWQFSQFSMEKLLAEVLAGRRDDCAAAGLNVQSHADEMLVPVFADRAKTLTLLEALLDNAIRYNRPGGHIEIQLSNCVTDGFGYLYLQIHNDGASIPETAAHDLFEAPMQGPATTAPSPVGSGLGLPLCRAIVSGMKGKIFLEPSAGEGTTFGVLLPTRDSYGAMNHEQ